MSKGTVAVVGASTDRSKFGNKAVRAYARQGWEVYPVNPSAEEVEGLRAYASVDQIPEKLDRVALYLPPTVGVKVLGAIAAAAPREFYVNPGAESSELMEEAQRLGLEPILACSILAVGESPEELAG
jgi:predicted CoA-binding protein